MRNRNHYITGPLGVASPLEKGFPKYRVLKKKIRDLPYLLQPLFLISYLNYRCCFGSVDLERCSWKGGRHWAGKFSLDYFLKKRK
jgi:hypothetical protein